MKKFSAFCFSSIIVAIFTSSIALAETPKEITVCTKSLVPFVILDQNNQPTGGFDIDLVKEVCKEMKAECKFIVVSEREKLLSNLKSGKCDISVSGITIIPERKKDMDFTKPYYPSSANFIALKGTTFTSSIADFKGKKIAVEKGSNFVPYLEKTYGKDIEIVQIANNPDAIELLKTKKVDASVADTLILKHLMKEKGNEDLRLIKLLPADRELALGDGYGIPVKKGNAELVAELNKVLAKIKASSAYKVMVKKYFK